MEIIKRFFSAFFYLDLRSLALLRIAIAGLLIVDLIDRASDIHAIYTDSGVLPRAFLQLQHPGAWFSLYMLTDNILVITILFIMSGVLAFMLLVGYRTTLATILSWIMVVSLQNRNPLFLLGGDQIIRLVLFWGIFLPWHARFSVDSVFCKKNLLPNRFISAATAGYILQIIFIYVFVALLKDSSDWRSEGTALYYALSVDTFRTSLGNILYYIPVLHRPLTHAVFILEAFGFILLFIPYKKDFFRFLAVVSFICFHLGIGISMRISIFPWVCIIMWLAFLPPSFWNIVFEKSRHFLTPNYSKNLIWIPLLWQKISTHKNRDRIFNSKLSYTSKYLSLPVVFFIMYVFLSNISTLPDLKHIMPEKMKSVGTFLALDQRWGMYAPAPTRISGWYVIIGKMQDGSYYDIYNNRAKIVFSQPKKIGDTYKNARWAIYLTFLTSMYRQYAPYYGKFLCHSWNKEHDDGKRIEEIAAYYTKVISLPNYKYAKPERALIIKISCLY